MQKLQQQCTKIIDYFLMPNFYFPKTILKSLKLSNQKINRQKFKILCLTLIILFTISSYISSRDHRITFLLMKKSKYYSQKVRQYLNKIIILYIYLAKIKIIKKLKLISKNVFRKSTKTSFSKIMKEASLNSTWDTSMYQVII